MQAESHHDCKRKRFYLIVVAMGEDFSVCGSKNWRKILLKIVKYKFFGVVCFFVLFHFLEFDVVLVSSFL